MQCKWYDTESRKNWLKVINNITSIYANVDWEKDDPFILTTQARQVLYTEDLLNGPSWRVVHFWEQRNVWDLPQVIEPKPKPVKTYSRQFDNVIALVETDEELNDDDDNDDKQSHYLDDQEEEEFIEDESDDTDEDTNIDNNSNTSEDD